MAKNETLALREGEGGKSLAHLVLPGEERSLVNIAEAQQRAEKFIDLKTHALKEGAAIVPIGDRVLVRRITDAEKTVGSIELPDAGKRKSGYGVVLAVGQGRFNLAGQVVPLRVRAGAVVSFGKYAGTDIEILGAFNREGECVMLREEEIFYAVMEEDVAAAIGRHADPPVDTFPS